MKRERKTAGITLIALVVTIVVLIILATISINLVMNGNIIGRAEKTSGIQDKATELERLELVKAAVAIDNKGKVTVEKYIEEAIKEGITTEEERTPNGDESENIITDNDYNVNIAPDPENPNNVIITIDGKEGELKPVITKINTSTTKTSITAKAIVRHLSGGTVEYYYKLSSAADSAYTKIENVTDAGATITGLTEGEKYDIKAVATNANGTDEMIEKEVIARDFVPVEKIILNKENAKVGVSATVTLIATVEPTNATIKELKWTSSNPSIAEANSAGIVTGKALGTATITVEATDGVNTVKTICNVTVLTLVTTITTTNHENILAVDSKGETLTMPGGFKYVTGTTVDQGVVIEDESENQFVWIPMADESDFPVNECEPFTSGGYPEEKTDYDTMKKQVLKHGGFYIGRYEAGVNTTTMRTAETEAQKVVCKAGVAPYNYVRWGESMSEIGTRGAVYLAKKMYQNNEYVKSTLCYNCQWDAMCTFIGDTVRGTPTKAEPGLTGSVLTDVSKNIYDLAGNCREWTMQAYATDSRISRGGEYGGGGTVSTSYSFYPDGSPDLRRSNIHHSFRCTLYIKD